MAIPILIWYVLGTGCVGGGITYNPITLEY